jgi:O-methyltransferase
VRPSRLLTRPARRILRRLGYDLVPFPPPWPLDFQHSDIELCRQVAPYTMTTPEAIYALAQAVRHIVLSDTPGAIVECGVWRGGSMMAVARSLLDAGRTDVDLYLFDTFEGMTAPTDRDVHWTGQRADALLEREAGDDRSLVWARASIEEVRRAMASVGYPAARVHFVEGEVERTIPDQAPERIALLRLDTDWYESTKHELIHLYPRLAAGGVLIVDDYGWWRGARQATDEYFREHPPAPLLFRIDDGGARIGVKQDGPPAG